MRLAYLIKFLFNPRKSKILWFNVDNVDISLNSDFEQVFRVVNSESYGGVTDGASLSQKYRKVVNVRFVYTL